MAALLVCLFASAFAAVHSHSLKKVNPDAFLTADELCTKYGFSVESHYVTTSDGYILRIFHIGLGSSFNSGTPVLLQHGLVDSSDTFLYNSLDKALGFALARAGYDVWLGNSRGNKYSRNHTHYDPDTDKAFWDFTWQDMASQDVPTQVNYVLTQSGHKQLAYIGHSQGTTQMFAHLSVDLLFADKLKIAIMLNPVASVIHQTSEILKIGSNPAFSAIAEVIGVNEVLPAFNNDLMAYACYYLNLVCRGGIFLIADEDLNYDNYEQLDVIMNHYPSGTSLKDLVHWSQMVDLKQEGLKMFDYGKLKNLLVYGSERPPQYDLKKIRAKIALFAGSGDRLADVTDVAWLLTQLPSESVVYAKTYEDFGHTTFIWGDDFSYFQSLIQLIN